MAKNIFKSGKQTRPKTAVKGKRYRCAKCRKRSPKPVKTPAPWYCPNCLNQGRADPSAECMGGEAKSNLSREGES
jgi:late competence protein required for DNA uptake (superfamily II DNA/RNA helicase)